MSLFLHGFGARYDLPISLALYMYGAGAAVLLSFVLVALFAGTKPGEAAARYRRLEVPFLRAAGNAPATHVVAGAIGVICLLGSIVTGIWGSTEPTRNPAAYLIWVYLWVGLLLLTALVGNIWTYLNPWAALHRLLSVAVPLPRPRALPDRMGMWPAVVTFFAIAWLELASGVSSRPQVVGALAIAYTVWTLAGMVVFGREQWLHRCEAFTVLFGIAARFAPVESKRGPDHRLEAVWLRPWAVGLLQPARAGWDQVMFVILMLSNLAFDGVEATPSWFRLVQAAEPLYRAIGSQAAKVVLYTFGLLAVALVFVVVFSVFMRLVIYFAATPADWVPTLTAFAFTLVPIALVYAAAHYYTYLIVQGQGLIPTLADPLARGWSVLPLRDFQANWALTQANVVWYAQVVLIVVGHVIAVYLAHVRASERFRLARNALISQYPMLILMVAYTMTSLWILAQPITD
jgi:hypothetical protein